MNFGILKGSADLFLNIYLQTFLVKSSILWDVFMTFTLYSSLESISNIRIFWHSCMMKMYGILCSLIEFLILYFESHSNFTLHRVIFIWLEFKSNFRICFPNLLAADLYGNAIGISLVLTKKYFWACSTLSRKVGAKSAYVLRES